MAARRHRISNSRIACSLPFRAFIGEGSTSDAGIPEARDASNNRPAPILVAGYRIVGPNQVEAVLILEMGAKVRRSASDSGRCWSSTRRAMPPRPVAIPPHHRAMLRSQRPKSAA